MRRGSAIAAWSLLATVTCSEYLTATSGDGNSCECPCEDDRDGTCRFHSDYCYTPVCTAGHYLCCGTCSMSTCQFQLDFALSTRTLRECILCPAGHYCPGCDLPVKCPENTYNVKLAQHKAEHCLPCPRDYEANAERTACCTIPGSATYFSLGKRVICNTDPVEVDPAVVLDSDALTAPTPAALMLLAAVTALLA